MERALPILLAALLAAVVTATSARSAHADDRIFEVIRLGGTGRTVAAALVELNGDGRTDVMEVVYVGLPPDEQRLVNVYLQSETGGLGPEPDLTRALPAGSAAYDLADVAETPGNELILLRQQSLAVVSLAPGEPHTREIPVACASTVGAAADERGLKRLRMVFRQLADEPWLLVPCFGELVAVSTRGEDLAQLEIGGRANYLILPRPGPLYVESDIQLFYDVPRVSVGDVDGDGRTDLVAASRHEIRVFLRRPDDTYRRRPDRVLALRRVNEKDHVRGSGAVRGEARDFDGDGRLDLLVSQLSGALTSGHAETAVYVNRDGHWDLQHADTTFTADAQWGGDELVDIDGDGRLELVLVRIPVSVVELIEALLTRELDARIAIHRTRSDGGYETEAVSQLKLDVPFSFDTGRPIGFPATVRFDLNADGYRDLVAPGDGERIEIHLGASDLRYGKPDAHQNLSTSGRLRSGDLDGDGLTDLLIYDPYTPGSRIRVLRNLGHLRGTPPQLAPMRR